MSGKLDQSLDEILSTRRAGGTRGRASRRPRAGRAAAAAAPVGGVKKNTKQAAKAPVPSGPAGRSGEGKISVSNLVSLALSCTHAGSLADSTSAKRRERGADKGMFLMGLYHFAILSNLPTSARSQPIGTNDVTHVATKASSLAGEPHQDCLPSHAQLYAEQRAGARSSNV